MKVPGVLGGLGPQTTADFYLRIQELINKQNSLERPPMLTWSVPLPYALEDESIHDGTGFDEISKFLVQGTKRLEQGGADFIVMPCNSLHIVANDIQDATQLPFISIVDETIKEIKRKGVSRVAILATEQTVEQGLYTTPLRGAGIEVFLPSTAQQKRMNEMVVRLINSQHHETDAHEFNEVVADLHERGAELAVLACTDFHILMRPDILPYIDTMEILAQATAREILS